MKLNRAHALLLVGTLSAGACVTQTSDDDSGGQSGTGGKAGKGGSGGNAGTSAAGKGSGGKGGTSTASGGNAGMSEAGAPSEGGMAGSVVEGIGGESGSVAEGGGGAPWLAGAGGQGGEGGAECNDSRASELTCDDLATSSCGIKDFLDAECAMTWKNMKPSISNVARNCMLELTQSELCDDATNTYHCVDQALHDACPDDAVVPICADVLATTSCSTATGVTAELCQMYLSGLTQNGRDQMVSCLASECDFYSCAESLN
jgi:hypothetical protein